MRCCVPNCCNNNKGSADNGISFHLFPKDPSQRSAWTSSLNITKWEPSLNSAVCSDHFSSNQLFVSKSGDVKVAADAVPVIEDDSELDSLAIYRVCRICLSMDMKTYELKDFKNVYELLTGFHVPDSMFLPQVACYECCQRLKNAATLREKAIKSDRLLNIVLKQKGCLTFRSVKEINRHKNNLNSSLIQKIYENDDWNLLIKDDENVKVELNNDIYNGNETYTENNDTYPENNDTFDNDTEFDVYNDDYTKLNILEVDIKNETKNEIFINEYGSDFESDDDKKLSEICQVKVKSKVKKKKEKLEKKVKIAKKKIDENDSVSAADKYKTSNVKRRKINNDIEESLFTVTHLTYEEQVKEVELRQESNSFKTAPYQCTVCYRGFPARERFDAHVVRHSEQSGAFECFICKTRLKTVRALRKHLTSQHTEKFSCKGCPFVTKNRGVARAHAKWHAGTKYQCQQCGAEFDKITTYMGHIRIKHVSDFICQLCGYTFISEKGIEVHKKKKHRLESYTVPEDGPYCEVCDVRFISDEAHDRHLKLSSKHTRDDDPERIRNDSQSINTVRKMRAYRKIERRPVIYRSNEVTKNSGGPVTCEQCGVQLRDLRLYAQHFRRVHPDKNRTKYPAMKTPAMCELCGRIFQSMALLQDHMWVHTGEKRFKCSRCPKSFTQKTNLVCHERVHSASRPTYECPLCGKHFAFYNNRRRHMFIHTGLKPHKCDTCGKCFTTAGEQRAHVDHVHMKKPWPKRSRRRDDYRAKDDE